MIQITKGRWKWKGFYYHASVKWTEPDSVLEWTIPKRMNLFYYWLVRIVHGQKVLDEMAGHITPKDLTETAGIKE